MGAGIPRITARQAIAVLEHVGFVLSRQSGSHRIYKNDAGKRITVPFHGSAILHPKILRNILRDAGISAEDFQKLS